MNHLIRRFGAWLFAAALVIAGFGVFGALHANAAEDQNNTAVQTAIDEKTFPDQILRDYVSKEYDKNNDGSLSGEEIAAATKLDLNSTGLKDTTGMEKLTALKDVNLNGTEVEKFDATVFPDLEKLDLGMMHDSDWESYPLSSIDVSGNPKLKYLDVSWSSVSSVDVSHNPELEELHAFVSNISSVDVTKNPKLRRLDVNDTDIDSIDVTKNPELFALNVEYTKVSKVDVTKNPKLYEVYMTGDEGIKSINLTGNPDLTHLRVSGTSMTSINLSKNPKLAAFFNDEQSYDDPITYESTKINPAPIKHIDFSHNPALVEIYLTNSPIEEIDVSKAKNLEHLQMNGTKVKAVDITHNPVLNSICVSNTAVKHLDISKNKQMTRLDIANTNIDNMKHIDFTGYKNILSVDLTNAGVESLVFDKAASVREVKAAGNHIKEIDLSGRENKDWYNSAPEAENQTPTIIVSAGKIKDNKIAVKDLFSDPARVEIQEGDGYTYDANTATITFKNAASRKFKYTWDTNFLSDDKFENNK